MGDSTAIDRLDDAETEFRRRLAAKLTVRGYEGAALTSKIDELLRTAVKLRLDVHETLRV